MTKQQYEYTLISNPFQNHSSLHESHIDCAGLAGRCIFYGMVYNSYKPLSRDITVEYPICQLYFRGMLTRLKTRGEV